MKSALDGLDMDDLQHMMNLLYGRDDGTDFDEEGKDENGGKAQVGVETIEDERKKRFENLAGVLKDSVKEKGGKVELWKIENNCNIEVPLRESVREWLIVESGS